MNKGQLLETITNLVLQSIMVWEDVHLNALSLSSEYNDFWELLDEQVRDTALKYQKQNKADRIIPFSINYINYYELLLTRENYSKVRGLHWREQLKIILADIRFRSFFTKLIFELKAVRERDYGYVSDRTAINR